MTTAEEYRRQTWAAEAERIPDTPQAVPYPPPLAEAALNGPIGRIVRTIEPQTEADPVAILLQLLVGWGSLVGRCSYYAVEADRHFPNLFVAIVGKTASARKGTSWGRVRRCLHRVDEAWVDGRVVSGLSSGEGLTWAVRDEISKSEPIKEQRKVTGYQQVIVDPGVSDKRLLVLEPELASVLRVFGREGNTLSAVVRQAWDDGTLRSLTKNSPAVATAAHISLVGHITADELRRYLDRTEMANGLGNRFLWACARRARILPFGGERIEDVLNPLLDQLKRTTDEVRRAGERPIPWGAATAPLWDRVYREISAEHPGLYGAMTSRAPAQVCRLALLYALADASATIEPPHLDAALAVWSYCDASVRHIFGEALGDPLADEILALLRRASAVGMTRTEINDAFGRHRPSAQIGRALVTLASSGLAEMRPEATAGRAAERWFACERSERSEERAGSERLLSHNSLLSQPAPADVPEVVL